MCRSLCILLWLCCPEMISGKGKSSTLVAYHVSGLDLNDHLSPIPHRCLYLTFDTVTSLTFVSPDSNLTYLTKLITKISLRHLQPIKNVGDLDISDCPYDRNK